MTTKTREKLQLFFQRIGKYKFLGVTPFKYVKVERVKNKFLIFLIN